MNSVIESASGVTPDQYTLSGTQAAHRLAVVGRIYRKASRLPSDLILSPFILSLACGVLSDSNDCIATSCKLL